MTEALWAPSPERVASTRLTAFAGAVGRPGLSYPDLHRWSVDELDEFWTAAWRELGMPGELTGPAFARGDTMASARFFPDETLNVAEVILDGRGADADDEMFVALDETGARTSITRSEARRLVAAAAAALRADGVGVGDRVVVWLPNGIEAVITMLAAASIGAVFSSTSPDFGIDGVLDRFGQIEPTVLVAADGYHYGGKRLDCLERLAGIVAGLPTLRRVVVTPVLGDTTLPDTALPDTALPDTALPAATTSWDDWLAPHVDAAPTFEQLPFDHPWYVLFSSGTTGVPKCIVHRTGGVMIQHLKEHQLHCDIGAGDRVMYFTTCGWMMWNWLVSVPASGATAVLYDGSPFTPGPSAMFDIAEREGLTFLGVGAKLIDSVRKDGYRPADGNDLGRLRTIASTGSPLSDESFAWVYEAVAADVHLASISGGTDLCGCFVGGDPTSPVYAGQIQGPALAMAVDVWTDAGEPAAVGERGELVCTEPFPSMPLGFWGDDDGSRYRSAYYERFPGVWAHGDFASWTAEGGMVIHGRSDTTLNPGGVRIGTAEIYRQVEQIPAVLESLVFGQECDGDTRIVLLVRLVDGASLDDALVADIKARIRTGCTPRHVPSLVLAVDDLPRTRSNKLAELAVTDAVNGREVRNTSALANPEAIDAIAALPSLR